MNPNTYTDLPAAVIPADVAESLPIHADAEVGDSVVIYSRGRYRVARVVKAGPKNIRAEYTTPGAIARAEEIAGNSRERSYRNNAATEARNAARYRRMADLTESLNITPTDGVDFDADNAYGGKGPFVALAALPAEFAKLDMETGHNAIRTTIVNAPAKLRAWADDSEARMEQNVARFEEGAAWDAKPWAERVAEHVHMTTKTVKRGEVRRLA